MWKPKKLSLPVISIVLGLTALAGCSDGKQNPQNGQMQMPAPSVSVVTVSEEPVGAYNEFVARTEASETVELRARVEGFIEKRGFLEGETVQKGQLLFLIDQAPFQAVLSQAKANLISAQAEEVRAKGDLDRGHELFPQGHISKSDLDKLISTEAQAKANVQASKAQLETARINLSYTEIRAPFSGRIGKATYSVGNLVGPSSSPLAELVKLDPMHVNFQVNEKVLISYQQSHQEHTRDHNGGSEFDLSLKLPNGSIYSEPGIFDFADIKVDETTGTINLRASFSNPDRLLLPGLYATLMVDSTRKENMPLIPQVSVQENQQGRFVLVVNDENKVNTRIIKTGRRIGPMWTVTSGLKAGEKVIVAGLQKVRPDITVNPVMKMIDTTTGTLSDPEQQAGQPVRKADGEAQ
ncbi:efflux RND transporter periplasmic adaptor subunit [Sansalvadorimonas verongulae]|uniref:efflux RND transporter periplasmic adaptor subunit n=1 Tax=Sansalvadorimonas verongulae TaxID=2172824 RepID=UPI0012BB5E0F|nr:efflux RND transporter periplasmic adaptor subunit [Sansalvadorimonas verongulae]MTI13683.1 efflux RND transporter periplasmic adaptor subunit [Sansalvadorimonas verongulae]